MSLLLLLTGTAAGINGAGNIASAEAIGAASITAQVSAAGIASAEAFGVLTLVVSSPPVFSAQGDGYFAAWNKHPLPARRPVLHLVSGCGGIASGEAVGRPRIGAGLGVAGIAASAGLGQPAVRRGFILQDEEFLLLAA